MALDFPTSPSVGQVFTSGGVTWIWDGTKWVAAGTPGGSLIYLPITGGTLTGPLTALAPGSNLDNVNIGANNPQPGSFTALRASSLNGGPLAGLRNRLINGGFRVDQRNRAAAGFSLAAVDFAVDRWKWSASQASRFTAASSAAYGILQFIVTASVTPAAGDYFAFQQGIEGFNILDLGWGAAGAKPVTLSFNFYSSMTGLHSGALSNGAINRSYPFSFNYPTANVWQSVSITIPGDTTGTWAADNTAGLYVIFCLGTGTTYKFPAGSWTGSQAMGATGSVNVCAGAVNSTFYLSNVQLEAGSVATPFEIRPYGLELSLCERYYQRNTPAANFVQFYVYMLSGANFSFTLPNRQRMRATPTATMIGAWTVSNCNAPAAAVSDIGTVLYAAATTTGICGFANPANGGFDLNAEL